jgi:hypothetical protein
MKKSKSIFKIAGYGLIIWAVPFATILLLLIFKINYPPAMWPIVWFVTIMFAWYFASFLELKEWKEVLDAVLIWVLIAILLDYLLTKQYVGSGLLKSLDLWLYYLLIALTPIAYKLLAKKL